MLTDSEGASSCVVRNDVTFALHPHELSMRVFDKYIAPIVLSLPGPSALLRLSLYRHVFEQNLYMWLLAQPSPSLVDTECFMYNLMCALGLSF
jgi:hypothetical protein